VLMEQRGQAREVLFRATAGSRKHMLKTEQIVLDTSNIQVSKAHGLYNSVIVIFVVEFGMSPWGKVVGHKPVPIA
jgi:hypothetical protein